MNPVNFFTFISLFLNVVNAFYKCTKAINTTDYDSIINSFNSYFNFTIPIPNYEKVKYITLKIVSQEKFF
ncbi:hypothetical protein BCR32DRAFT_283358 [Anaeromyces robustus]|uniref:Uncharacterized protein n=1 Tax=Anaeromyces robustus TaxID=1754192 RepID=A0A1Y1WUQ8_9FUNG|nr:hypothetical protein BCR32DRAFT_283358 [Anaeromyces robustus]|eukprot:ORX77280.1 hypothetical protein BCR32DRAFT_283358 [Anaeromyces robustus]